MVPVPLTPARPMCTIAAAGSEVATIGYHGLAILRVRRYRALYSRNFVELRHQ